ncbi:MAG: glycosyl transferase [Candidatus Marinimicrobia bacterium]|nr:glycosyl transferase [Candidatus Neomarinimicrobiota bacterium]
MKVFLVHYWLNSMRGGEKVLEQMIDLFPEAKIITNYYSNKRISKPILDRIYKTSLINNLPFVEKFYRHYLPIYPLALKNIKVKSADVVISSESGPAKGIQVPSHIPHICYTHTPMRYIWDMQSEYFGEGMKRKIIQPFINYLRKWDYNSAQRVDFFVANSHYVKKRIRRFWGRTSEVIYPPVDTKNFSISNTIDDYYLLFGQSTKYKRHDLAVKAFNENKKKLIVIGEGEELTYLKSISKNNISFLGRINNKLMKKYLSRCRALIFPGIEDFGIIPVECMASGRPVIAFNKGGATETIINKKTGLFFDKQSSDSLNQKINDFELIEHKFDPLYIKKHSLNFDKKIFKQKFLKFINNSIEFFINNDFSNKR